MTVAAAMTVPKSAVTYLRISKDKDNDELGVARQREALRDLIEQRGWVLVREFVDNDISASKGAARPQYEALQRALRDGLADVLVVTEISRLTRRVRELEDLVDLVEATKVEIQALRAGTIDLSTSGGRANARILGVMARMETEQMSERIQSKMAEIARKGGWRGGVRPFGYDVVNGTLTINKRESKLIRSWARDVLAGRTLSSISAELNDKAVPTVRGGRWTSQTVNQILTSPRIIGMTSSGGEPIANAHWEPIIDRADWERIQSVLAQRKRGPAPRRTLLAGLVWCGVCGSKMWGASRGPNRPRLYACQKLKGGCGRMSVTAHALDEYIVGSVLGTVQGANLTAVRADRHKKDAEHLSREIVEDEQLLIDLAADLGTRTINRAEWLAARGPIESRLRVNRDALGGLGVADPLPPGLASIDNDTWNALPFDQQRAAIALFVDRVDVFPIGNQAGRVFRPERVRITWKA